MRALKALVIFLGVLIIGGVVVIGLTIYQRARAPAVENVSAGTRSS